MPMFDYRCNDCTRIFDVLVRTQDDKQAPKVLCPDCRSPDVTRLLSVFAVGGQAPTTPSRAAGACGSCGDPRGPGACQLD